MTVTIVDLDSTEIPTGANSPQTVWLRTNLEASAGKPIAVDGPGSRSNARDAFGGGGLGASLARRFVAEILMPLVASQAAAEARARFGNHDRRAQMPHRACRFIPREQGTFHRD